MCGRIDGVANFRILNSITVSTTELSYLSHLDILLVAELQLLVIYLLTYSKALYSVHGAIFYTLSYQFIALQNIVAYAWLFVVRF